MLDGALALALPCQKGQRLSLSDIAPSDQLIWQSWDDQDQQWFNGRFDLSNFSILESNDPAVSQTLQQLLTSCQQQNPSFLSTTAKGIAIDTYLEFPRNWGLGSSSTLMALLAQWAEVDAYQLLRDSLGGSGYDIACAQATGPLFYQLINGQPQASPVTFQPSFHQHLYFVYLGKKQNSREGIQHYRKTIAHNQQLIDEVSELSKSVLQSTDLANFQRLLSTHEDLLSATLKLPRVQHRYFNDFSGVVKSLGAWGGDFVLAASDWEAQQVKEYFQTKGMNTIIPYQQMVI